MLSRTERSALANRWWTIDRFMLAAVVSSGHCSFVGHRSPLLCARASHSGRRN
jgi:hypothetical protein